MTFEVESYDGNANDYYTNWTYVPENSDDGYEYTLDDVIEIAKGNIDLAKLIIDNCEWQYPETVLDEMLMEEEVIEVGDQYIILGITEELIRTGLETGIIRIFNEDNEPLSAEIGMSWFYFGGHEFENVDPKDIPTDIIVNEIKSVLDGFSKEEATREKYLYYYWYLVGNLGYTGW